MKIRMKFRKQGSMKFIGHLDMMRYFQKVMRRADVDIRYSEGFSPHQIMSFASPLGVGLLSNGEYVDIEVHTIKSSAVMLEQINAANVEGIEVTSCRRLPDAAKNAMSLVAAADYTVWIRDGYEVSDVSETEQDFWLQFEKFCEQDSIPIVKKTKKGEKEMDLRPLLYEVRIVPPASDGGKSAAFLKLSAGSASNVKPELVLRAFYEARGREYPEFAFQIQREELYGGLEDEERRFIPLEEYGENIE